MEKNIKDIEITRPNQELIVLRGIPGSGKSTVSKKRVGNGIIHSTDDLIEATGDYDGYFKKMVESGDWSEHSRMHNKNFLNAKKSMEDGITPVIIDNTNIKASEPKKYVEAALEMGMDDKNIIFVDVGTGGQTAEVLAERNTHNVPLETIKKMMASHKGVGPLTVRKVLKAKDMFKPKKFASVKLDDKSRAKLLTAIGHEIPKGWTEFAHHMTINFGKGLGLDRKEDEGDVVELTATHVGISDMAIAVMVNGYPSDNGIPHITLGVNPDGGKPVMSNAITVWSKMDSFINLKGVVTEQKLK